MSMPIVLPNRKCGTVKRGLYAIGRRGPGGTLNDFTALVAPFPAEISNPRKPEVVSITTTLGEATGLWPPAQADGRFAGLPPVGFADLWGIGSGYRYVIDVIEETRRDGISRRIAQVPDVRLPCPVLMMHMHAEITGYGSRIGEWLAEHDITNNIDDQTVIDQPWREAESLGRVGDPRFLDHPHIELYRIIPQLAARRLLSKFKRETGTVFEQGVFGLSWVTDYAYVLGEDETEVPEELAKKGVLPAVAEGDPRGAESGDPWSGLEDW